MLALSGMQTRGQVLQPGGHDILNVVPAALVCTRRPSREPHALKLLHVRFLQPKAAPLRFMCNILYNMIRIMFERAFGYRQELSRQGPYVHRAW